MSEHILSFGHKLPSLSVHFSAEQTASSSPVPSPQPHDYESFPFQPPAKVVLAVGLIGVFAWAGKHMSNSKPSPENRDSTDDYR